MGRVEQSNFLSNRSRAISTAHKSRDDFLATLERASDGDRRDGLLFASREKQVGKRGDHDLNPGMVPPTEVRKAAVLVPIVDRPEGLTLLLTKRSETLPVHKGQVSFPGGRVEESDRSHIETALRETEEEIGLPRAKVQIVGRLDTYTTRTAYDVTPVIGIVSPPFELVLDPVEVEEAFEVPLEHILDRRRYQRQGREWQGATRHFYVLPHDKHYIWGATAGMLVNLAEVMQAADG